MIGFMSLSFVIKLELIIDQDTNCLLITFSGKVTLASTLVAKVLWPFKRALSGKVPLTIAVVAKPDHTWVHKNLLNFSRLDSLQNLFNLN